MRGLLLRELLARGRFGYQRIALPFGMATQGHDRSVTARRIFPDDLGGRSVLDVGSRLGYFCFEATRRGARGVVGVDVDPGFVDQSRLLSECLGLDAAFRCGDAESPETLPADERFDYVLCLNVLHHVRDPVALLGRLCAATRERLVLEVAGFGRRDRRRLGLPAPLAFLLSRLPVAVIRSPDGGRRPPGFFLSPPAVRTLLERAGGFERIEILPSAHKQRFLVVATRKEPVVPLRPLSEARSGGAS